MYDLMTIFAYGPPGGIDAGPALFWVSVWTAVMGTMLYVSLFAAPWPQVDEDEH